MYTDYIGLCNILNQVTKSAVIHILKELLKEPDFKGNVLELGLKAAHARMAKDTEQVNVAVCCGVLQ